MGTGDAALTQGTQEAPGRGGPAAGSDSGPRRPGRRSSARIATIAAAAVAGALLFLGYLRVSWTVAATSDGAAQALQARDMLAGNWLLHGWTLSDVSFYTTELPEYVLVEAIRPFGLGVIHAAAAATYTMLVLAVFALAYGRARGREGILRGSLAAVIMLAPQLGYGAFVLLLSPDHTGTALPLLLGWLLLDLAPRRWWVPTILCLLLAVVQFADRVALLTAVLPLIVVCGVVAARGLARRRGRECRFELALIAAGIGSVAVAWAAARLLAAAGGFVGHPFPLMLAPLSQLWTHTRLTGWGVLELYGANFTGVTGPAGLAFAALHLVGLTLATVAVAVALVRFIQPRAQGAGPRAKARAAAGGLRREGAQRLTDEGAGSGLKRAEASGLVDTVLAVAVIANLVSYLLSTSPGTVIGTGYAAREIAAVLPLGAVLAGRMFGTALAGRLRGWSQLAGGAKATGRSKTSIFISFLLFLVIAGYASAFAYSAAQPATPGQDSALTGWLVAHGLRYGLGEAEANVASVESGGRVDIAPVSVAGGRVRALLYQSSAAAYDPALHDADFLVTRVPPAQSWEAAQTVPAAAARATFGAPARTYRFDGFTVLVWNVNLLTRMVE